MPSRERKIPDIARYSRSRNIAYRFILEQNITYLPVDPFEIARKNNWRIKTFSQVSQESGLPIAVIKAFIKNSDDGGTLYCHDTNEYCILYNEKIRSKGRIRWTIMHEIGHIVLRHFVDFSQTRISRGGLTLREYKVLETEADHFAFHILAPPVVLHFMQVRSARQISQICGLSKQASNNRYKYQKKWNKRPYIGSREIKVIFAFYNFIYQRKCSNCGYGFILAKTKYCPICGHKLKWGKEK